MFDIHCELLWFLKKGVRILLTSWLTVGISAQATGLDEEVDFPMAGCGAIMTGDWFTVTLGA